MADSATLFTPAVFGVLFLEVCFMGEKYEVVGIREVNYVNKRDQKIIGRTLYAQYCRDDTAGVAVLEMYVPGTAAADVQLGDVVTPLYNRWGRVVSVVNHGSDTV